MSACGHAEPRTSESEARHQRKFAAGVGPRRYWKKVDRAMDTFKIADKTFSSRLIVGTGK